MFLLVRYIFPITNPYMYASACMHHCVRAVAYFHGVECQTLISEFPLTRITTIGLLFGDFGNAVDMFTFTTYSNIS